MDVGEDGNFDRADADDVPASRPGEHAVELHREQIQPGHFGAEVGMQIEFEIESRLQVADGIETPAALDSRHLNIGPSAYVEARLHGRRGDGEIAADMHADDADGEARAEALEWHGQVVRQVLELGMEAAGADEESRVFAKARAKCELPCQRYEQHARIAQHCIETNGDRIELHRADEIHLQAQDRETGVDQRRDLDDCLADDRDLGRVDQQTHAHSDQARRAPAQL